MVGKLAMYDEAPKCFGDVFKFYEFLLHPTEGQKSTETRYVLGIPARRAKGTTLSQGSSKNANSMYYVLCIMHYALCIMYYVLCIMYYVLCIMYLYRFSYTLICAGPEACVRWNDEEGCWHPAPGGKRGSHRPSVGL